MRIAYFTHSLASCWNHGNAHFLRGVVRDLIARGHEVSVYEPSDAWSRANLQTDHGDAGLDAYRSAYPELASTRYGPEFDVGHACDGADLVIVHEWNTPELVAQAGCARRRGGSFRLLFHDTHHRLVSDPSSMAALDLSAYDGVLAFGETLSEAYRSQGWSDRVWTWHEAADVTVFHPPLEPLPRHGLVWVGNWGDGERGDELESFLFGPARAARLPLEIYGVRYPDAALKTLQAYGATYRGWLPNVRAPEVFGRALATVHVPRRYYVETLPGIPTIRVFEALACGVPLVSAPWRDDEHLFRPGDYLVAADGATMTRRLRDLDGDADLRRALATAGRETILARHTCAHRVDELLAVARQLGLRTAQPEPVRAETTA